MARLNREVSNVKLIKNEKSKVNKTHLLLTINIVLTLGLLAFVCLKGL